MPLMNFLAHIYLSGNNTEIRIGNFIADWIKGDPEKLHGKFDENIIQGILIHRFIDSYTDTHPIVHNSILKIRQIYHKHSGIVIDIFYDHFLAKNFKNYSDISLNKFAQKFYSECLLNFEILPPKIKQIVPKIIASNRLKTYETIKGIENVLKIMENHTSLPKQSTEAIKVLNINYLEFDEEFTAFFQLLKNEIQSKYQISFTK